jgi:hypothetical protein
VDLLVVVSADADAISCSGISKPDCSALRNAS